jgi:hypothetical protein
LRFEADGFGLTLARRWAGARRIYGRATAPRAPAFGYLTADLFLDLSLALDDIRVFFLATTTTTRRAIPIRLPGKHVPEEVDSREDKWDKNF